MSAGRRAIVQLIALGCLAAPTIVLAQERAAATNDATESATASKPLDLRAPDITKLYMPDELQHLIAKIDDKTIEEIEVRGAPVPPPTFTPKVWGGIAAPFWALLHPTQSWRIFLPLPPDQVRGGDREPDFTSGYLEPAAKSSP